MNEHYAPDGVDIKKNNCMTDGKIVSFIQRLNCGKEPKSIGPAGNIVDISLDPLL